VALLSLLIRPHFSKLANRFFGSVPSLRNATLALLLFFSFDILTVHTENLETARVSLVLERVIEHIDAAAGVLLRGCGMGKGCCISAAYDSSGFGRLLFNPAYNAASDREPPLLVAETGLD